MTTRLRRSIATLLAALIYVQAISAGPYPAPVAAPLIRLGAPAPAPAPIAAPKARSAAPRDTAALLDTAPVAYASAVAAVAPAEVAAQEPAVVFGPNQYVRTTGAPNIYTASFAKPEWLTGPFTMRVVNGSPSGTNRLSSTTILLNGVEVAVPTDFGQQVAGFDKVVTLQAENNVELRVTSIPTGYLTLSFLAASGDQTAPQLAVTSPPNGAFMNAETATVTVQASDAGSGIATATLHILIDGADRTAEFTVANGTATAQIGSLAPGTHTISATVSDMAGNTGSTSSSFTIDRTVPQVSVTSPGSGTFLNGETTTVTVQAADAAGESGPSGIDPATLSVSIDGVDHTAAFTVNGGTATAQIAGLAEGAHTITVSIEDVAGNTGSTSSGFTIDRTAPQIVIVEPAAEQYTNAQMIDVRGGVIDATNTTVMVDGNPATVTNGEFVAGGIAVGTDPTQAITVIAADAAGNSATATVTINIDRAPPVVAFTSPAAGAVLPGSTVAVSGTVEDAAIALVDVNGQLMTVTGGTFAGEVPVNQGSTVLVATAHDKAGNQASAERTVFGDSADPVVTILEPAPGTITNQSSILVRVSVSDASATVVTAGGVTLTPNAGVFEATLPLPSEGTNLLIVTAVDAAGNEAVADVQVVSDRSAPELTITNPAPGALVPELPVTVSGTVTDLTGATVTVNGAAAEVTGATWSATLTGLPEGDTTFTVVARDVPGNESTRSRTLTIDLHAPIVTIATPQSGLLTGAGTVTVTGTVQDVSVLQVVVNGVDASLDPAQPGNAPRGFTAAVAIDEGDNTIVASATDGAQRPGSAQVLVTRDSTPPTIALTVGPKVTRARPAAASIIATDLALDRITVTVNGVLVETFTAPPYVLNISAPDGSRPGDVLAIVAEAVDRVGNTAQATAQLPVASDGAVVGQVLSDVTGLPIANPPATVSIDGAAALTTDDRGRYSFATGEPRISLSATAPGMTSVDRAFDVASEAGTVALDARLTPIAPATTVGAAAATIAVAQSGAPAFASLSLIVPAGAFADGSSINATALSGQGLPGLLPLGWSPVAAIDLRGPVPAAPLSLRAQNAGTQTLYLARYLNRTWYLASEALTPDGDGTVTIDIPSSDQIALALVTADTGDGAPAVPAIGDPLPGVASQLIPLAATSAGVLNPPTLSPGGGTSIGTLTVTSPTALPSGTVVQAVVTETFTLANGDTISTDARTQDFVLYRRQADIVAVFPVVPSRSFATADLVSGIVHLDILAGRETVRGQAGGSGAVTLTTTGATLSVAQGALTDDVPIVFQSAVLSSFLPSTGDVSPLLEFAVDFSGRTLSIGAEFSILASQLTTIVPGDALVVVRVDSLEGRSRLVPVAIGELVGDRYVARALHGLPGITKGGRHVWYRVAGGVGFVRGFTDAGGTPFSTIVEVSGLPFASVGAMNGQYTAVSRPGAVTVRARAQGTSLVGEGDADVTANAETALSITLNGAVTEATITPADGAIQVSPAIQVEVASAVSITGASVATATIQFLRTSDPAGAVPYRVVLSGSGRTLAIVPLARLAEGATYSVAITGLADAVGGAVTVPPTSFTITSNSSPQYDLDKLVFSFPDADGRVRLTGPPGTLAPGSTILVVNETTGEVSTLPVFNDGSVGDFLVAQISDRLIVTITDLQGRTTTFKRSEYVAEDGTTAVGAGGGQVIGTGGVEVRIPEDAVMNGAAAILKIAAITPDQLPAGPLPDVEGVPSGTATVATSLKIESTNTPGFRKEVDLVFPKPPDAPEGAVYFVYRRLVGPDGRIAYETIDSAAVEGEGANAKVVTASDPFSGYIDSIDGYSLGGFDQMGGVSSQLTNYAILMFYFDLLLPGAPLGGSITGKVMRVKWAPGATTPTYEPVPGVMVRGSDAGRDPLLDPANPMMKAAKSQGNGTYALYDRRYEGGAITLYANDPVTGQLYTSTAYEVDPQTAKTLPGLRFVRHNSNANFIFPPLAPPAPPSPIQIKVMTTNASGVRQPTTGIVIAGQPILVGVKAGNNTVQRVDIKSGTQTAEYGVRVDPEGTFDVVADSGLTLPLPGTYTITVYAFGEFGGVVSNAVVVRAAAEGGGNNDSLPDDAPAVITERTVPKNNAAGVKIGILPQIVFTEPVQNVPGAVSLSAGGIGVPITITGVGPGGPIESLGSASIVTSITIEPIGGLEFGTHYTLELSDAIYDTDDGANGSAPQKPLTPYSTTFTTFAPETIGQTDETFTAGGIAVIGNRAFVAVPQNAGRWFTNLRQFDVSDPTAPLELGQDVPGGSQINKAPPAWWLGLPVDVASEENSDLIGGNLVAVATTPLAYPYHTSAVRLYDVSREDMWKWVGAVSLGREPSDGMIRRIRIKGETLYAATAGIGKGIQIVDLNQVRANFNASTGGGERTQEFWRMLGELNSMHGYSQDAITQTIEVDTGSGANSQLWDLAIAEMPIDGLTQTGIVATGRSPLVIASETGGLIYNGEITFQPGGGGQTSWGFGVAAGTVAGKPIAAVAALGAEGPMSGGLVLAIVDLTDPRTPRALDVLFIAGSSGYNVHDVVLRDTTVYIGTTTGTFIVSVADPENPELIGTIPGVSGRLAFTPDGLLMGTHRALVRPSAPEGGLRTAVLEKFLLVSPDKETILTDADQTLRTAEIKYRLFSGDEPPATIKVEVLRGLTPVQQLPAPFDGVQGETAWPAGSPVAPNSSYFVRAIVDEGTPNELASRNVRLPVTDLQVVMELERQAVVMAAVEGSAEIKNTYDTGSGLEPPVANYDYKNESRTIAKTVTTGLNGPLKLEHDYVIFRIKEGQGLVFDNFNTSIELPVPETGEVTATMKATSDLEQMGVDSITIVTEYFPDRTKVQPLRVTEDELAIVGRGLFGHVSNMAAGVFGRGEGTSARVTEMIVGLIPFAGDGLAILGEVFNAIDPNTDVGKVNASLSGLGLAGDLGLLAGPLALVAVPLDKLLTVLRIGLKHIANAVGVLRQVPGRIWDAVQSSSWNVVIEYGEGTLKFAWAGGGELTEKIVKEEADIDKLNKVVKRYSDNVLDTRFVEVVQRLDSIYDDPDALAGAIRVLGSVVEEGGDLARLSDEAVEGAVKFLALIERNATPDFREGVLRAMFANGPADADALLKSIKATNDPDVVRGIGRYFSEVSILPCPVPGVP